MKPRLTLLMTAAGGLALFAAMHTAAPANGVITFVPRMGGPSDPGVIGDEKKMIWEFPLPGEEPEELAEFDVRVHVDPTDGKNRFYFDITESHGYYVEYLTVEFFYKETPESTIDDSPLIITERIHDYLKSKETMTACRELGAPELRDVGGQIGTTENWGAEVVRYRRARLENPEVLRKIVKVTSCD